ncbi:helix-turn-helix transcriptional regulator [Microlunatus soli]|uniref:Predicted DNA-binding transcriptional regulator YafY, contains an HTH and WYL domains n=1 Tax=Microlunatus soli TaxID=630515 RepID=A0A1H1RPN5_9ACTN|nr:YafY family protein [Microlunatus soli]SDS37741.1 Predicted DNA-binding transcriptional regulator YafY, contains an HTH and WYL domains [Microlunatus soli]
MRADRLLTLVALLRRHGKLSAVELARRLEVDRRTVLRDVEALSTAGFGIYTERGRNGGITLLPEYRPDVGGLTADETRALFLAGGQPALARLGLAAPLASALTKLGAGLPSERQRQLLRTEQRIVIDPGGWTPDAESHPDLDLLQQAVFTDRRLRFDYQPMPPRQAGIRTVDPYGLLQAGDAWYLIAAHRGRPRTYRISRMSAIRLLPQPSNRPDDLDLRALWEQLRGSYIADRAGIPIRLRTTPRWIDLVRRTLSSQLAGPAEVTVDGDGVIMTAPVIGIRGAVGVLAGFGELIEVLEPPELINGLLDVAHHIHDHYTRTTD